MRMRNCAALVMVAVMILFLASIASTMAHAQGQQHGLPTRHVREAVVNGQAPRVGLLPRTQSMDLAFMLPMRNQTELDDLLQELYDPYSPSYRQYLTLEELTARFGPTQEDYDAVIHFAEANGMTVTATAPNRLVVFVTAPLSSVEKALHVTMGMYQHPTENRTFYAPDREPWVELNVLLWHIAGLDNYSIPRPHYRKAAAHSVAQGNTTGGLLGSDRRTQYGGGTSLTGSGQSVGLFEYGGYDLKDVTLYFTNVNQPFNSSVLATVPLLGASTSSDGDDTEQVIDIVEALSMAPGLSNVVVYIAPPGSASGDVAIFNQMLTNSNTVKQVSVSYGWKPADPSSDTFIFKEMAGVGQSVFAASGDFGAYPNSSGIYYPAEDAWVTAVGGTDPTTLTGNGWVSETAWLYSGGGISPDGIPIPSYQQVSGLMNSVNGGSTKFRNVPDVSAEADNDNYYCANSLCGTSLGGTSLAAPTWAGFIALVNQKNAINSNPMEGFLNPTIYTVGLEPSNSTYFETITSGNNDCCGQSVWYTATGASLYNLVTGWGSPRPAGWLGDFSLSATPSSQTVYLGSTTTYTVSASPLYGFTGSVTLSLNGQPKGVTGTFSTNPISGRSGNSALAVTVPTSVSPGTYTLKITGTSGAFSHQIGVTLIVAQPTAQLVDHMRSTSPYVVGDTFTLTITGAPNQPVTLSEIYNGVTQPTASAGTTNASGVLVLNSSWTATFVGTYKQTWYVGGIAATPILSFTIVAQPTAQLVDHMRSTSPYVVGDTFTLTVTGAPNQPVTLSEIYNGVTQPTASAGTTNASGVLVLNSSWSATFIGTYQQTWYVGGIAATPILSFQVVQ